MHGKTQFKNQLMQTSIKLYAKLTHIEGKFYHLAYKHKLQFPHYQLKWKTWEKTSQWMLKSNDSLQSPDPKSLGCSTATTSCPQSSFKVQHNKDKYFRLCFDFLISQLTRHLSHQLDGNKFQPKIISFANWCRTLTEMSLHFVFLWLFKQAYLI